jgi:hypothetical protein
MLQLQLTGTCKVILISSRALIRLETFVSLDTGLVPSPQRLALGGRSFNKQRVQQHGVQLAADQPLVPIETNDAQIGESKWVHSPSSLVILYF